MTGPVPGEIGPNEKALLIEFIAIEAVPSGGGFGDGAQFFLDANLRQQTIQVAVKRTKAAIQAIKSAPDNPFGDDNEAIAGALLQRIRAKRNET